MSYSEVLKGREGVVVLANEDLILPKVIDKYLFLTYIKNSDTPAILMMAPMTSITFTFCLKIR